MKKLSNNLIVLCLMSVCCTLKAQVFDPDDVRFRHISIESGLSQSSVHRIIQDHRGFLWICTQDGLNKFDGYQFTVYGYDAQDTNSLADDYVYCVLEDAAHTIWVGTDAGGLNRLDRNTEKFKSYRADSNNPNALPSDRITVIYELEPAKTLLIGTDDAGLCLFDIPSEKFTPLAYNSPSPNTLKGSQVNCIVPAQSGKLWIGTNGGLNEMDLKTYTFRNFGKIPDNANSLIHNKVWDVLELDENTVLIATEGGLSQLDLLSGQYTHYTSAENPLSLASNNITDIHRDREGVIWLTTENGIHIFEPQNKIFHRLQHDPLNPYSIANDFMLSIFEDRTGVLWFGSRGGALTTMTAISKSLKLFAINRATPTL